MQRTALPIAHWLDNPDAAGGPLTPVITRLVAGDDLTVPAGRRSVSVSCLVAAGADSPVITTPSGSAVLAAGMTAAWSSDYPGDQLAEIDVTTVVGDDVTVIETFLT